MKSPKPVPPRKSPTPFLDALGIAMVVFSVGLLGTLVAYAAGYSEAAFRLNVLTQRLRSFPTAARQKNVRCSYGQAWSLSPNLERIRGNADVRKMLHVERRDGGFVLVQTPLGPYWIPARELDVLAETIADEQRNVYEGSMAGVQKGDVVLDCGANIGTYTRHALERGAKLVVAIELAPESLECLRRNLEKEIASGRVVVYPKGVWNKDDVLQLSISDEWASTAASVVLDRGGQGPKVPLTTIDKLVAELRLTKVDFVKMDIEGSEMQALEGAVETVRRFHPRMAIAVEHRPSDPDRIPELVHRLWPEYQYECGPCTNVNGSIQPDVLFARVR